MAGTGDPPEAAELTPPHAAVIIPHYDDTVRLATCLAALLPDGVPDGVEVVVADNGSTEDVEAVVAAHPGVRLVHQPERGAGPARNKGVEATTAPRLFFLDADCRPSRGWIAVAGRAIEGQDVVGGSISVFDETPAPRSGAEAFESVLAFQQRTYVERFGFTVTANMLTWRRVFEDVGGFQNGVPEDMEWCARARAKGYRIAYADDLHVSHPTRSDWPSLRKKWVRLAREHHAWRRSKGTGRLSWAGRAIAVLCSPVRDVPRFATSTALNGPAERFRGVATLVRLRALRCVWMLRQAAGFEVR